MGNITAKAFVLLNFLILMAGCTSNMESSTSAPGLSTLLSQSLPPPAPTSALLPTFKPPGRVIMVNSCNGNPANDTAAIIAAQTSAGIGNTVQFANGQRCLINSLTLASGVYFYVPSGEVATLVAAVIDNRLTFSNNVTVNGLAICSAYLFVENTTNVTIGNSTIGGATCAPTKMSINGTTGFTMINNNFINLENIVGYMPTRFNIDGNRFDGCVHDCIGMPYGAGSDSFIQRNVFLKTQLAVMEIGFAATNQATTNFRVINNWSGQSLAPNNPINGWGYQLAYSIPLNGAGSMNNLIADNYADGMTQDGPGDICIEVSGSATVRNNQCANFDFGAIGYGSCLATAKIFTDNNFSGTKYGVAVSYEGCSGASFQVSGSTTNLRTVPAQPQRIPWGGRN